MDNGSQSTIPTTNIGDVATTSCERCKKRKIRCDRKAPCSNCTKSGSPCVLAGSGEKQRPVPKSHVQALERHVASLELFIQRLALADSAKRDEMLAGYLSSLSQTSDMVLSPENMPEPHPDPELVLSRAREGQLRKLRTGNVSQFFGGTSLFQIHAPNTLISGELETSPNPVASVSSDPVIDVGPAALGIFTISPRDEVCLAAMANFFKYQYVYHMCMYREFFLRDYDAGGGRYYSDVLLYALCSMGALADGDPSMSSVSEILAVQAESLVYASLDRPDITLLQALILLGYRCIGHGKASKGWLFCGMAFRLAHEMGLHLDPNNWKGPSEPQIEHEISRRVYWAAFNADKQLSLYFGRPPALYSHESDVLNTIRIPYPDGWQGLLETYIAKDVSATAYEDGIALAGSFIYRVELMKIVHNMITDLFENRRNNVDSAVLAATVQRIHVSLNKWLTTLPGKLHWNQWSHGQVQPFVLHLHMLFHTAMIILHRPPRHLFTKPGIATSEDVEFCYESLQAMLKLLRSFSRFYNYAVLPLNFIHTLSVTAGTILMKRFLENLPADDSSISKAMDTVLEAMNAIRFTWPAIIEVRDSVVAAMQTPSEDSTADPVQQPVFDFEFHSGFDASDYLAPDPASINLQFSGADLGELASSNDPTGEMSFDQHVLNGDFDFDLA
ncbi:fungal-specific transcription factor domain-containing protein [Whalleya microplaca]|nr:fungal-specific transcription factor domain-containing protein [Whalleya microplaca]